MYPQQMDLIAMINTSRLGIYASFVESLEISRSPTKEYRIKGIWKILPAQSQNAALLPNLRRLTYTGPQALDENQLDYLTLFLSSTTREIEITTRGGYPLWQSLPSASKLLDLVSHKCSGLEHLRIYPRDLTSEPGSNTPLEMPTFSNDLSAIHEAMSRLGGLQSLTISPAVLEPDVFHAISACSHLETLIVQSTGHGGLIYEYKLDEGSFPALRHLELINLDPHIMGSLCDFEPLLHQLEHASVTFGHGCDDAWDFDRDRVESLYALVECCPRLTELRFNTGFDGYDILMIPNLVDLLRPRTLRYLNLSTLGTPTELTGWSELLGVLPLLEEFHLPTDTIRYPELRHFATMLPRLRFLALSGVWFDGFDAKRDLERVPSPSLIPVRLQCTFRVGGLKGQCNTVAR
ncbi:hypothetical protein FRC10_007888 [Ceratobasidium sp. 414]|nr:hypothetical protein FRC10_007888 [Ceratobasidium sp. 414]